MSTVFVHSGRLQCINKIEIERKLNNTNSEKPKRLVNYKPYGFIRAGWLLEKLQRL